MLDQNKTINQTVCVKCVKPNKGIDDDNDDMSLACVIKIL